MTGIDNRLLLPLLQVVRPILVREKAAQTGAEKNAERDHDFRAKHADLLSLKSSFILMNRCFDSQ